MKEGKKLAGESNIDITGSLAEKVLTEKDGETNFDTISC